MCFIKEIIQFKQTHLIILIIVIFSLLIIISNKYARRVEVVDIESRHCSRRIVADAVITIEKEVEIEIVTAEAQGAKDRQVRPDESISDLRGNDAIKAE